MIRSSWVNFWLSTETLASTPERNFGWFTTLMANLAGPLGSVHAFEPVPTTFEELRRSVSLLKNSSSVELNKLALNNSESESSITVFAGQPTGHASLAANGVSGSVVACKTIRLDDYLERKSIDTIHFLKADAEGAELSLLQRAETLFKQALPPVIIMEMARGTSASFGYAPNDLLEFIGSEADFSFYKINEVKRRLIPLQEFELSDPGANVLCVPAKAEDRVRSVVDRYLG